MNSNNVTQQQGKQIQEYLIAWYQKNHRKLPWRETTNPYYIWISEVMLQQTQVKTVIPYYNRFIKQFPDIQTLACTQLQNVLKAWEGLGYYSRARNLYKAAKQIVESNHSKIPNSPDEFIQLPGVGNYICAAVQSIAFNHPLPVLDGNVKRVLSRLFSLSLPVNASSSYKTFYQYADAILDHNNPSIFNQAMMELGALQCSPKNPLCSTCPLSTICEARTYDNVRNYPVRLPKKKIPEFHLVTGVIQKNNKLLIYQRQIEGFLGGLWEFPNTKIEDNKLAADKVLLSYIQNEWQMPIQIQSFLVRIKHAYTHFKIIMDVYICSTNTTAITKSVKHKWIEPHQIENYPFPASHHKFFNRLFVQFKESKKQ